MFSNIHFRSTIARSVAPNQRNRSFATILPHFNYRFIRDNTEQLAKNAQRRGAIVDTNLIAELYERQRKLVQEISVLNRDKKEVARSRNVEEGKRLKEQLGVLEEEQRKVEEELEREALKLPNDTHPSVPDSEERTLKVIGEKATFGFPIKDHLTLGTELQVLDFESAALTTGEKFYFLKNEAALLEFALINWSMQKLVSRGWTPVIAPDLIRTDIAAGCGFQPRGASSQIYCIENESLCLAGTAEIPLAGMYANRIIDASLLPLKFVGFNHAFRVEVGHRGTDNKGLYRVHQFSKVEMFAFGSPLMSELLHQEMLDIQEELFQELGLHFKVLDMPTNDLGAPAYRKFDIEAWMPGRNAYGEISSTSNCTDYQSRRLNIRFKVPKEENRFVHTVNGTACAVPRVILAIMENFQEADGSVSIPKVLQPFMGGIQKIQKKTMH